MRENRPFEKDEALRELLQTWKPEGQLPPRFQEAVWSRIAAAETPHGPSLMQTVTVWLERILSRPAFAACYVSVLLFAGLSAGYLHAEGRTAHAWSEWRTRYVQAVDPYQMPRN